MRENTALEAKHLFVSYGRKSVLKDITFDLGQAEIVAVIGHNGAGKSALLKALFGVIAIQDGIVEIDGRVVTMLTPRALLQRGISYVPQGNRVFGELTVRENVELGGVTISTERLLDERIKQMLGVFPLLGARIRQKAATLSGGEKQMLALANAMVLRPRLLLLDEPSLGLSPVAASGALGHLARIRENGVSVLVIEQKVREVLKIARRVLVLRNGAVSFFGFSAELQEDEGALRKVYF